VLMRSTTSSMVKGSGAGLLSAIGGTLGTCLVHRKFCCGRFDVGRMEAVCRLIIFPPIELLGLKSGAFLIIFG